MSPAAKLCFAIFVVCISVGNSNPVQSILIDEPQRDIIDLTPLGVMLFNEPDLSVGKIVNDWDPSSDQNPEELGSYVEGDMLIPGVEGRNGVVKESSRWPDGVVPYVISPSMSPKDRDTILRAMEIYRQSTCIKFVPKQAERDYISIESSSTGCWSSVGRVGRKQIVNLQSPGCTSRIGTPLHELMHALGFLHEQNRYDRDDYVRVVFGNIKPGKSFSYHNFQRVWFSEKL